MKISFVKWLLLASTYLSPLVVSFKHSPKCLKVTLRYLTLFYLFNLFHNCAKKKFGDSQYGPFSCVCLDTQPQYPSNSLSVRLQAVCIYQCE